MEKSMRKTMIIKLLLLTFIIPTLTNKSQQKHRRRETIILRGSKEILSDDSRPPHLDKHNTYKHQALLIEDHPDEGSRFYYLDENKTSKHKGLLKKNLLDNSSRANHLYKQKKTSKRLLNDKLLDKSSRTNHLYKPKTSKYQGRLNENLFDEGSRSSQLDEDKTSKHQGLLNKNLLDKSSKANHQYKPKTSKHQGLLNENLFDAGSRSSQLDEQKTFKQDGLLNNNLLDRSSRTKHLYKPKTSNYQGRLNEKLFDEGSRSSQLDEQKTYKHQRLLNNNLLDKSSRTNHQYKQKRSNENLFDEGSRSSQLDEQKTSKHNDNDNDGLLNDNLLDKSSRANHLYKPKTSKHQGLLNKNLLDKNSRANHLYTPKTTIHQGFPKGNERQAFRNQDRSSSLPKEHNKIEHQVNLKRKFLSKDSRLSHLEKQGQLNENNHSDSRRPVHVNEPKMVSDNEFAYMVAVMKEASYVCAGALIDESWVLTAADGLYAMSGTPRFLRIRLGSINYKKGGTLLPVKYLEIHPYFDNRKPAYDLALVMLAKPVRYTPSMRGVRLQLTQKEITATHLIMTTWPKYYTFGQHHLMKRNRILSMTHLHPVDPEECVEELKDLRAGHDGVMCLETGLKYTCMRDEGAPVVINGVLWGIISSWVSDDCDEVDTFIFANLVSATNVSTWIHATVHGHKWDPKNI